MAYDVTHDKDFSMSSEGRQQHSNPLDQGDQDEYVSGSPQNSPKKVQKFEPLSKMLGGRDLDAEDDDEEMEDDENFPSSAS